MIAATLATFVGMPWARAPQQWIRVMSLGAAMGAAVTAGTMRPAIIISPQLEFPAGTDDECVDGPGSDPQVQTWAGQDVPDWALSTLRVGLIEHAHAPLSVQGVVLRNTGHRLTVWQGYLPQALHWLGPAVPGFSPSAPVNPSPGRA